TGSGCSRNPRAVSISRNNCANGSRRRPSRRAACGSRSISTRRTFFEPRKRGASIADLRSGSCICRAVVRVSSCCAAFRAVLAKLLIFQRARRLRARSKNPAPVNALRRALRGRRGAATCCAMNELKSQDRIVGGMAGRYATALFDLARDTGTLDAVAADLDALAALLAQSPELRQL